MTFGIIWLPPKRKQSKQPITFHGSRHVNCGEDRISSLPDCLLIEIISRLLDTEQAIRTGTLSKRWQHLWPHAHNLVFEHDDKYWIREFLLFVGKTLTQCVRPNINKFKLHCFFNNQTKSQVPSCIRYAIDHNVQEVEFNLWDYYNCIGFVLPPFFFSSSSFINLKLRKCTLDKTVVISWKNLKSLSLTCTLLEEDLIQSILSGSPLLETLVLSNCYGFDRLDITSKSVKNLVFSGVDLDGVVSHMESQKINAPYILSLTINNTFSLYELLLLNVSSATKAELNYSNKIHYKCRLETNEEMLKGLILSLRHVKELKIGKQCLETIARLEAKGFTFPSNMEHHKLPAYVSSSESEDCSDNVSNQSEDCSDNDSNESEDCSNNDSNEVKITLNNDSNESEDCSDNDSTESED